VTLAKPKRKANGGLVLARKIAESITILDATGNEIKITVSKISGNRVSLHVNAPESYKIVRSEIR
jgi:carbon storage regulator CsrA